MQGEYPVLATLSGSYPEVEGRLLTCYSPVRRSSTPEGAFPLDLHVLSTPPAFVLSQDQTLHRNPKTFPNKKAISKPKNEKLAIARIIVRQLKKKPPPQPNNPKKGPPSHEDGIIQTNSSTNTLLSSQKSDAHLRTSLEASRGQPEKTYRSCHVGVKSDRVRSRAAHPALPKTGGHLREATPEDYLVPGRDRTSGWGQETGSGSSRR